MQTMTDKTYNGWSNYETWNVALWLSNDEGTYNYTRELADEAKAEFELGDSRTEAGILADSLESFVEEMTPDLGATMFADLLGKALGRVDWYEIAENILSE